MRVGTPLPWRTGKKGTPNPPTLCHKADRSIENPAEAPGRGTSTPAERARQMEAVRTATWRVSQIRAGHRGHRRGWNVPEYHPVNGLLSPSRKMRGSRLSVFARPLVKPRGAKGIKRKLALRRCVRTLQIARAENFFDCTLHGKFRLEFVPQTLNHSKIVT